MSDHPTLSGLDAALPFVDRHIGLRPADIDMLQLYDCYTITVLLTIEQSGFCEAGRGLELVRDNDLSYRGSFPVNTHGGMLGMGQPGFAGGLSMVTIVNRVGLRLIPGPL